MATPSRFGIIGTGWRAHFFVRIAAALPARFRVAGVVTRSDRRRGEIEEAWGAPVCSSTSELARHSPDFVVVAVPREAAPAATEELVGLGVPVLVETPPAPDLQGLRDLWASVGSSGLVQVAEQYMQMPGHAARLEVIRSGILGDVSSVHVSSTHLYHAASIMRSMLGAGFAPATVTARSFTGPLADPVSRQGWSGDATARPAETTLALIDFGGPMGLYDFTDNQWHNPLRTGRLLARGSRGELADDRVVRLVDARTVVESRLERRQTGLDLNLEGFDLDHISFEGRPVYRNAFPGARLSDEEIAIATMLARTAAWCQGEDPGPYPLAEACQDHLIGLGIEEAVTTRSDVSVGTERWAGRVTAA
ncbi:Gfo/Idh/MocA family protein [Georgenia sp. SYP-B2076]|uniref:Gfo/Idh/MocA family protein n=1 Tax=Georgenia sp. SYP-B2076 TaxID=2495881 RepID=UPI000F8D234E|nr:Gfo/Idh/MocA family oxidoreductase [Georgenia sp. SYP-B2076]